MKKVAIVGVEGSGKTVMLAGLGDLYSRPDDEGYFLAPKNYGTAAYVAEKIARMRSGEWPTATAEDVLQGLDWTLKQKSDGRQKPVSVCEISCLDFAGEVYRAAYGISGARDAEIAEKVDRLKDYIRRADDLIVLINLRDVIAKGLRDTRVQEAMWITKAILDVALHDGRGGTSPRAAIVLSQADSYAATIAKEGGALGVLRKYLPHVANDYDWLDIFEVSSVDKTFLDDDGNMVPAPDFKLNDLCRILNWIIGENGLGKSTGVADNGDRSKLSPQEAYSRGEAYFYGKGVENNYDKAFYWYSKAAEQGYSKAEFSIGWMYENGRGVSKDAKKAEAWYRKAAEHGDAEAKKKLAGTMVNCNAVNWFVFTIVLLSALASVSMCLLTGHWVVSIPIALFSLMVLSDRGESNAKQTAGAWLLSAVFLLGAGVLGASGHWIYASISAIIGPCFIQK